MSAQREKETLEGQTVTGGELLAGLLQKPFIPAASASTELRRILEQPPVKEEPRADPKQQWIPPAFNFNDFARWEQMRYREEMMDFGRMRQPPTVRDVCPICLNPFCPCR